MKPTTASAARASSGIPPVAASPTPAVKLSEIVGLVYKDEDIMPLREALIGKESNTSRTRAIKNLRDEVPETVDLLVKLLTTGTPTAHRLVRQRFTYAASSVAKAYSTHPSRWQDACQDALGDDLPLEMRQAWNFGNVLDESGHSDLVSFHGRYKNVIERELEDYDSRLNRVKASDEYWRGVAAFTITDVTYNDSKYGTYSDYNRDAKRFIVWSGKQDDIALVVKTAIDRDTIDIDDLKDIIASGDDAPVFRDGVL